MPSLSPRKIKGIHYAWIILACVMILSALRSGLRLSFGVLINPLMEQFGWSLGAISLAYTISFLSVAPMTFVIGWLGETIGARRVIMISALTVTAGMLLTGTVRELWQFYIYYGVIIGGLGTSAFHILLPVVFKSKISLYVA
ncbi:MAG: MFS transporter, partial [Dehalococcoidia bacterium]